MSVPLKRRANPAISGRIVPFRCARPPDWTLEVGGCWLPVPPIGRSARPDPVRQAHSRSARWKDRATHSAVRSLHRGPRPGRNRAPRCYHGAPPGPAASPRRPPLPV